MDYPSDIATYTKKANTYCSKLDGFAIHRFEEAKAVCNGVLSGCMAIYDSGCDGKGFDICLPGSVITAGSFVDSCIYTRGKYYST